VARGQRQRPRTKDAVPKHNILPRTTAACRPGLTGSLFLLIPWLYRSLAASHGGRYPPLFLGRQLEYVIHQQLALVFLIARNEGGVGPENTQWLFSRLNNPEGMAVPGLIAWDQGSSARPNPASNARGPAGSWVRWRSCHAADRRLRGTSGKARPVLENKLRAMSFSFVVNTGTCSGM